MNIFQRAVTASIWVLLRFLYRIDVNYLERIPKGGAILAPNHVSYIDAVLISAHVRRPVSFAMYYKIYNKLSWIVRPLGAFPIASKTENPEIYQEAFKIMRSELIAGNLVCIFPEGMLTTDGELNEFRNGILKLLHMYPVETVPIALKGLWGTYFSKKKRGVLKFPDRWMSKIVMEVGYPLPPHDIVELEPQIRRMLNR